MWYFKSVLVYILLFMIVLSMNRDYIRKVVSEVEENYGVSLGDGKEHFIDWTITLLSILFSLVPILRVYYLVNISFSWKV